VKTWFQGFAFKWVNLCRYGVVKLHTRAAAMDHFATLIKQLRRVCDVAGLCDSGAGALHEVLAMLSSMSNEDPGIVSRSFATLAFLRGGAVQVEFSLPIA
jgi:alpha/beta superfamily hydrolase